MKLKEFYKSSQQFENNVYNKEKIKSLKQFFPKHKDILDLGCGNGEITKLLSKENKVIGADVSEEAIENCRAKGLTCVLIDFQERLPYKNDSFDFVFLLETLEHVFDTESLLKEIKRILKKDGTFIISVPNVGQLSNRIRFFFDMELNYVEVKIQAGHIRFFTKNSIEKLLTDSGFKINKILSPYVFIPVLGHFPVFGELFPSLGTELVISCGR